MFTNNVTLILIHSDNKELFRKCWNKTIELIGINNPIDFVETTLDDSANEFVMVDVHKNASAIRDKSRSNLVIVLHSVFNNFPLTSLVQYRY